MFRRATSCVIVLFCGWAICGCGTGLSLGRTRIAPQSKQHADAGGNVTQENTQSIAVNDPWPGRLLAIGNEVRLSLQGGLFYWLIIRQLRLKLSRS